MCVGTAVSEDKKALKMRHYDSSDVRRYIHSKRVERKRQLQEEAQARSAPRVKAIKDQEKSSLFVYYLMTKLFSNLINLHCGRV